MKNKIQALHAALNKLYSLDSNWRNWGNWPDDVEGSTLHPGASKDEIAGVESRIGQAFPPSYREFLAQHRAWEHFWGDFCLVGTGPSEVQKALDEIAENTGEQKSDLEGDLGEGFSDEAVAGWESKEERHLYLGRHIVIGTDFSGAHWVFDTNTRRDDGEMTLTHWDISYGAQDPNFATFGDFLDWALNEVNLRIEQIK